MRLNHSGPCRLFPGGSHSFLALPPTSCAPWTKCSTALLGEDKMIDNEFSCEVFRVLLNTEYFFNAYLTSKI
jgi:hypothetical protein